MEDYFSKWLTKLLVSLNILATIISAQYQLFAEHWLPEIIASNSGSVFISALFKIPMNWKFIYAFNTPLICSQAGKPPTGTDSVCLWHQTWEAKWTYRKEHRGGCVLLSPEGWGVATPAGNRLTNLRVTPNLGSSGTEWSEWGSLCLLALDGPQAKGFTPTLR